MSEPIKTPAWISEFEQRGVAIIPGVLDDALIQPVIDEISAWVDQRAQVLFKRGEITDLHLEAPFQTRYGLLYKQSAKMQNGLDLMYSRGSAMFNFLHNKALLDVMQSLVGPDISCNPIQHLRAKPPIDFETHKGPGFHNVSWHQDVGVMMAEAEASNIVTCWIPLVDATGENGCMQAMPGLEPKKYIRHIAGVDTTIDPARVPEMEPVSLPCKKGDLVLLNRFTPHCSTPNQTTDCRWSLDCRFQTTGHHTGRTAHPAFSVRGAPSDQFPAMDYQDWCDAWINAFENPRGEAGHRFE